MNYITRTGYVQLAAILGRLRYFRYGARDMFELNWYDDGMRVIENLMKDGYV